MAHDLNEILSALDGCVHRDVDGYDDKYFPELSLAYPLDKSPIVIDATLLHSPAALKNWLDKLGDLSSGGSSKKFILDNTTGGSTGVKLHLVNCDEQDAKRDGTLAIGLVLRDSEILTNDNAILTLCSLVSCAFMARPDRLFMHGFLIQNTIMEMWTFDRAGAYAGKAFDILQQPDRFRAVITKYMSMNDKHLGLNPFLQKEIHGAFIDFVGKEIHGASIDFHLREPTMNTRLLLDDDAFVKQHYLIGPGTTCFKARVDGSPNTGYVVKFTWIGTKEPAEKRLLELSTRQGVRGVVRLEAFHDLTDIAQIRQGLKFGRPFQFQGDRDLKESQERDEFDNLQESQEGEEFDNLQLKCVVTSPLGRSLDTFSSPSELFIVLRDAIKALSSLYFKANIIHRDISTRNIVIVDDTQGRPTGLLIDLDGALDIKQPPAEKLLIGSQGFMAIGIMGGDDHSYRHDLESLFYVFLWLAICYKDQDSTKIPPHSRLQAWTGFDFLASFHAKMKDMAPVEFSSWIENEFTHSFKPYLPLANALHELLFPIRNGKFFIGTDLDHTSVNKLYSGMMSAFDMYITD